MDTALSLFARHRRAAATLAAAVAVACVGSPARAADVPAPPPGIPEPPGLQAPQPTVPPGGQQQVRIGDFSVVELRSRALPDARLAELGADRQGGGIVIDDQGLVLTIGYLVVETEKIEVIGGDGEAVPATLLAYDSRTGLGLVRAAVPLRVQPIEFAESAKADVPEPVLVVGFDGVAPAYIVSRRQFAGSWEYLMEDALFTAPATTGWSGAALINNEGKLLGIGSLLVPDALGPDRPLPGNMFVPIDELKPILSDLVNHGKTSDPPRPWLGVNVRDIEGRLLVTQTSPEGPADKSGIEQGDIILGLAGRPLRDSADFYKRLWQSGRAGVQVELDVLKGMDVRRIPVTTADRAQYLRQPRSY